MGLTRTEQAIFNEILSLGECSLGEVIKRLRMHKGTAYNSIRRLEEKGFVSFKNIAGVNIYSINVLSLKKLCHEETALHQEKIASIQELIKKAERIRKTHNDTKIDILLGSQGFKSFFNALYEWAYKTKKEYYFLGKGNEMIKNLGLEYYQQTQLRKKRLKLRCRVILDERALNLPVSKYCVGNIRYMHTKNTSPMSIWIYGTNTALVLWDSKPITIIMIQSKEAATSFKNYFESIWSIAHTRKQMSAKKH